MHKEFLMGNEAIALGAIASGVNLVCGYPDAHGALIRWFMVAASWQRQGVGSGIFADVRAALTAQGFTHLELRVPERAEETLAFWAEQGFVATGERDEGGRFPVVTLARDISAA